MQTEQKNRWRLFWLSFLILYLEIMAIRWLGIEMPTVRVFPNIVMMVILIATSAGLIAKQNQKTEGSAFRKSGAFWVALSFILSILIAAPQLHLYEQSIHLHNPWSEILSAIVFLLLTMMALYIIFLKLGSLLGNLFNTLPPLTAYSVNLIGSLAGTLVFSLISYFATPPCYWLLIGGSIIFILRKKPTDLAIASLLALVTMSFSHNSYWSPYSKLDVLPIEAKGNPVFVKGSYILNSNNKFFHFAVNTQSTPLLHSYLTSTDKDKNLTSQMAKRYLTWLDIPFLCTNGKSNMLILGAGSGNDTAYALSKNVLHIDAVEIDPIICQLGKTKHPNLPYLDKRVNLYNEDARTFLRHTQNKYDLIEFAYLDPGNTLCSSSFLRVDSYVYTKESIESVLRCLNPYGIALISFAPDEDNCITAKLYNTIKAAWGQPPTTIRNKKNKDVLLLFGPGLNSTKVSAVLDNSTELELWIPVKAQIYAPALTDQWPFLYTSFDNAGILLYFAILLSVVILPAIAIFFTHKKITRIAETGNMFLLGLAFMLIETKSIVQLSLFFGATWIVSAAVITTVLSLALLGNLIVQNNRQIPLPFLYIALASSILLDYFVSIPQEANYPRLLMTFISVLIPCLPILFSGMIFSSCFRKAENPSSYFAANLLGVAFGGIAENLSLIFGIKGLAWVALGVYTLSVICVICIQRARRPLVTGTPLEL